MGGQIRFQHPASENAHSASRGNPGEFTIRQLAALVRARINPELPLIEKPLPAADPTQRHGNR
ncbi:MAG: hypothetical protein DCF18_06360 [Cyanobium sp.]|nr:MAG: hypothetical protein DCF18_06360 [Cyanobium sp.]